MIEEAEKAHKKVEELNRELAKLPKEVTTTIKVNTIKTTTIVENPEAAHKAPNASSSDDNKKGEALGGPVGSAMRNFGAAQPGIVHAAGERAD
jgi:hypothetical protein